MADRKSHPLNAFNTLNTVKLLCLTLIYYVFHESINHGFVQWDDQALILENEILKNLTIDTLLPSIISIFSETVGGSYIPMTMTSFGIDTLLFGFENPGYWHLHNILLHLLCSTLVFHIGRQIGLKPVLSIILMMVFALHPMKVETVAWLSERKDLLYNLYFLSAILVYLKMINGNINNKVRAWTFIYILFACSLMSKIQAVTLPLSFLCFDYLLKHRITKKNIISILPMLSISLAFGLFSLSILAQDQLINVNNYFGTIERISIASFAWFSYLIKFLFPYELSPIYLLPSKITTSYVVSLLTFATIPFVLYKLHKKRAYHFVFALMFFTANIFFLLQWVGLGKDYLSDRFTYLPYLGLCIGSLMYYQNNAVFKDKIKLVSQVVCGLFIIGLCFKSKDQLNVWKDTETLSTHIIESQGPSVKAYWLRANHYREHGSFKKAKSDYDHAIELDPEKHAVLNARGKLFFIMAKDDPNYYHLALKDFNDALTYAPAKIEYLSNRGASYVSLKQETNALNDFNKAIEIDSEYANAYLNRSVIYNRLNLLNKALIDLKTYLDLKPDNHNLWYEAGKMENKLGLYNDAIISFTNALHANVQKSKYYQARALAFKNAGNIAAAKADLEKYNRIENVISPDKSQLSIR